MTEDTMSKIQIALLLSMSGLIVAAMWWWFLH